MDQTTIAIEALSATLVDSDTLSDVERGECPAQDTQPRTYTALTERPADFEGYFVPPRRQFVEAGPTYKALTERPANFEGLFGPRRQETAQAEPIYRAMARPSAGAATDEAAATKAPLGLDDIAA
jgi:hypothetical protein